MLYGGREESYRVKVGVKDDGGGDIIEVVVVAGWIFELGTESVERTC